MESKRHGDRITLAGIKIFPRIGVPAEERAAPQECAVDVIFWSRFKDAASADSLDQSIDYCRVLEAVRSVASARDYVLLETLACDILRTVLNYFPVVRARIKIRKRPAVLQNQLDFVEVDVEGSQQDACLQS